MGERERTEHDTENGGARELEPELLAFAPLIYVAWADGMLTSEEIAAIRDRARSSDHLDARRRNALARWLDPDAPPDAATLSALLDRIRSGGRQLSPAARGSLAAMGSDLAETSDRGRDAAVDRALRELEEALGLVGAEAARSMLGGATPVVPETRPPDAFDPRALNRFLDRDNPQIRRDVLSLLSSPSFAYVDERDTARYRDQVATWCRTLGERGYGAIALPVEFGGEHDVARSIAVFETLAYHDLSLLVKFGVQYGLFMGSIYQLGTRRHHVAYLRAASRMDLPGCYAMTETAHGSNVRALETTATYDDVADAFIIHTPHAGASKDFIGGAGRDARMATVFAQLEVAGEAHGVHAFLVPIRDEQGRMLPGVSVVDCGVKEGLNGVDNGRIGFDHVRIPRDNLLNRFGDVAAGGAYTSPIPSPTRRFFTMLGTLVAGRTSIASAATNASKSALAIAIRYTASRRQFGPEGGGEVPVLDYLMMQRRLLPRLAATYALDFAMADLVRRYTTGSRESAQEIEAAAAGLKAVASAHAVETIQACREACGGQGYMWENRLPALRADTDVFTTFEGANAVLLQLVARGLLIEYREAFGELRLWTAARYIAGRAAAALADLNPIPPRRTDEDHLLDPDFHRAALRQREERLLTTLARRLRSRLENGVDSFVALNEVQDHAGLLAEAHVQRVVLECFLDGIAACGDPSLTPVLRRLCALYALSMVERHAAWYLEKGLFEGAKSRAVRALVNRLCRELRPHAVALVDGFGIPEPLLAAPIAVASR